MDGDRLERRPVLSQVSFNAQLMTGIYVQVMGGWDRTSERFFLRILQVDPAPKAGETIWSSSNTDRCFCDQEHLSDLNTVLFGFGIEAPSGFWTFVSKREGNVFHTFDGEEWTRKEV